MRPPIDTASGEEASSLHRYRRRESQERLCIGSVFTKHDSLQHVDSPTMFSDVHKAEHLEVSDDGLMVTYNGPGAGETDAASVLANTHIPTSGIAGFYFEVTVIDQGSTDKVGLGLSTKSVKLGKMPGWESGSFAYHGDDGRLFKQNGRNGEGYGPTYGTGDIIGCCWDLVENLVFFTKNGKNLGPAFQGLEGEFLPTVGMQSKSGQMKANFGSEPFVFDIESYAQQQKDRILNTIIETTLPKDYRIMSDIVLSYLMHHGYSQTAAAFAKDAGRKEIFEGELQSMTERQAICEKVQAGNIDAAIEDLNRKFPEVLKEQWDIKFLLRTQKFIEMIVSGTSQPEEVVEYGKRELAVFRETQLSKNPDGASSSQNGGGDSSLPYDSILRDVYLLLAYGNPAESPTGYLTEQSRREMVADKLNSAILASQGRPMCSILERFISQNDNTLRHIEKMINGPAAVVSSKDMM